MSPVNGLQAWDEVFDASDPSVEAGPETIVPLADSGENRKLKILEKQNEDYRKQLLEMQKQLDILSISGLQTENAKPSDGQSSPEGPKTGSADGKQTASADGKQTGEVKSPVPKSGETKSPAPTGGKNS